jgi:hypothetical protein
VSCKTRQRSTDLNPNISTLQPIQKSHKTLWEENGKTGWLCVDDIESRKNIKVAGKTSMSMIVTSEEAKGS